MKNYKCEVCSKYHKYYGQYSVSSPPEVIKKMRTEERKMKKMHDSLYHVEGLFFVCKASLRINVIDFRNYLTWKIWTKISESDFEPLPFDLQTNQSYYVKAKLVSPIFHYEIPPNLSVNLVFNFRNQNSLPLIEPSDECRELKQDFINGISINKLNRWMNKIYHPKENNLI